MRRAIRGDRSIDIAPHVVVCPCAFFNYLPHGQLKKEVSVSFVGIGLLLWVFVSFKSVCTST